MLTYIYSPKQSLCFHRKQKNTSTYNWICLWWIASYWVSFFVDKEFGEVPLDKIAEGAPLFRLQELPQWVGIIPIHLDLGKHVEFYSIPFSELLDFSLSTGLLCWDEKKRKKKINDTKTLINNITRIFYKKKK